MQKRSFNKNQTNQTGSIIVRKIPDDLRRTFKSRCAADGISQQYKIIEMMKAYVEKKAAAAGVESVEETKSDPALVAARALIATGRAAQKS